MYGHLFLQGLIMGFMISWPLGPIGLLIIQKTVNKNRAAGLISGMGAALADTCYAIIAGFSLTFIIEFIKHHHIVFQVAGGVILLAVGLHIYFKNPVKEFKKYQRKGGNYFQDFIFTFLVTLSNPLIVFLYLAALTGSGVVLNLSEPYDAFFIISGVYFGGFCWWTFLTGIVSIFRHRFNLRILWWFNKIAGITIIAIVVVASIYFLITGNRI